MDETQYKSMIHWNGNMCCGIDCETTGLDSHWHEIWQLSILPLDSNFNIYKKIIPFSISMKPEFPERIDEEAKKINRQGINDACIRGMDKHAAIDLLINWFDKLKLPFSKFHRQKQIIPLGQNYAFDMGFLIRWLGVELYGQLFHFHFRDTMTTAAFLNDLAGMRSEQIPYPKVNLKYLCNILKVELDRREGHDSLADIVATVECYKKMMRYNLL